MRRFHPIHLRDLWLAVLPLALLGCTSMKTVPPAEQTPGRIFNKSMVFIKGGQRYQFERIAFLPDSLTGELKVQVEKRSESSGTYYEDELQTFRFPRADVDSVATIHNDPGKTLLYGVGLVAAGFVVKELVGSGKTQTSTANGGKNGGGGP